jgi:hypothetical protein
MKTATETSRGEETAILEPTSGATAIGAEPDRLGSTTTAGCWSRTTQQGALAVLPISDAGAQQLCAALCFIGRQVPNGVNIVPISTKVKPARWNLPIFTKRVYHSCEFSW